MAREMIGTAGWDHPLFMGGSNPNIPELGNHEESAYNNPPGGGGGDEPIHVPPPSGTVKPMPGMTDGKEAQPQSDFEKATAQTDKIPAVATAKFSDGSGPGLDPKANYPTITPGQLSGGTGGQSGQAPMIDAGDSRGSGLSLFGGKPDTDITFNERYGLYRPNHGVIAPGRDEEVVAGPDSTGNITYQMEGESLAGHGSSAGSQSDLSDLYDKQHAAIHRGEAIQEQQKQNNTLYPKPPVEAKPREPKQ